MLFAIVGAIIALGGFVAIIISEKRATVRFYKKVDASFGMKKFPKADIKSQDNYFIHKQEANPNRRVIDHITWNDLDMDRVFASLNHCQSSVGEEYLYDVLREDILYSQNLSEMESALANLKNNPEIIRAIRRILAEFGKSDYNYMAEAIYGKMENKLKFTPLYYICSYLPVLSFLVMPFNLSVGFFALLICLAVNIALNYTAKKKIELETISLAYISNGLWAADKIIKLGAKELDTSELEKSVKGLKKFKSRIIRLCSFIGGGDFVGDYIKIFTLAEIKAYIKASKLLNSKRDDLGEFFQALGKIDLLTAILSYRESLDFYCLPEFGAEKEIDFVNLVHPLVENPVGNSHIINKNSIITGSNASGKSTFIKSLAVNGVLAQSIGTCTAQRFSLRASYIVTAMAVKDSIIDGDSYYIAEVKALKRVLDWGRLCSTTCFIDEILRGTNTAERIAASLAILKYINSVDILCVAASHDLEIAKSLEGNYQNFNFCEAIINGNIVFDYILKEGISTTRNAIKLLEAMGFPRKIIEDANNEI